MTMAIEVVTNGVRAVIWSGGTCTNSRTYRKMSSRPLSMAIEVATNGVREQ
jgi:hypothetical protein